MKTNKKGISLIVLIITILVMIIIAAAVILYLDDEKVISNAKRAVTENDIQVAKEILVVAKTEWRTKGDEIDKTMYPTLQEYARYKLEEAGFEIGDEVGKVDVAENGTLSAYRQPVIPKGYVASSVETEDEIEEGLVIYEGTEPVTDANVDEARETRNQFVWVPVPNINEFVRKDWGQYGSAILNDNIFKYLSYYSKGLSVPSELDYKEMKSSIAQYGGFYIGRYEATKEGSKLIIQKNKNLGDTMWHENGESFYKIAWKYCKTLSNVDIEGHLVYGEEWDATLNYIAKTVPTYPLSSNKGNYTGTVDKTGSNKEWAVNNIYDMAGNVSELTEEWDRSPDGWGWNWPISRGGSFLNDALTSASCRDACESYANANHHDGFRPALYLK